MKGLSGYGFSLTSPEEAADGEHLLGLTAGEELGLRQVIETGKAMDEEIELGLSLGAKKWVSGGGRGEGGGRMREWGQQCRILTAKDLPSRVKSLGSPISSSSSVSSSSGSAADGFVVCAMKGVKSAADLASPYVDGASNPSSHVLVGWPPVRSFRMNNLANQSKESEANPSEQKSTNDDAMAAKEVKNLTTLDVSRFVKANMDGDPIGRKVDINAHHSYDSLALALELMFFKHNTKYGMIASKLLDGLHEFALTYEDRDGDWMLVGDVPWGMFLGTVKRLRIMRTSEASGQK
ncbi:hypothetical protein HPP92_025342 [Vanilla planifolia]|uniref:Auxin-responsive protein n=1 Tax=Vanilla planifolia TaxID=51239 RepID=A0A835U8X3_VANPL|nr:hypothetical protein HPP92_025342 [Vanilla planifolia]